MLQQHDAAPESAHRVGQPLTHDVKSGPMNGLKHAGVAALWVNVGCWRNAQAACQCGSQVAQNIRMQVGGDHRVQRGRAHHHASGAGIDQFFVPGHVRELMADLPRDLVPHHHGMALRVGLGHHCQQFAGARLRQLEGVAHDALNTGPGHHRQIGSHFNRLALVRTTADACVFAFRVFADDDPVEVFGFAAFKRAVNARQNARWPHVGVLVKALANF